MTRQFLQHPAHQVTCGVPVAALLRQARLQQFAFGTFERGMRDQPVEAVAGWRAIETAEPRALPSSKGLSAPLWFPFAARRWSGLAPCRGCRAASGGQG